MAARAGSLRPAIAMRAGIAVLAVLSAVVLCADVLAAARGPAGSAARALLAPACTQDPARSPRLGGRPLGACARCIGIHAGALAAAVVAGVLGAGRLVLATGLLRRLALAALAVTGADVLAGMLVPAWDHPALRTLTGLAAAGFLCTWALAAVAAEPGAVEASGSPA